jgi:glutamate dehydrogenase
MISTRLSRALLSSSSRSSRLTAAAVTSSTSICYHHGNTIAMRWLSIKSSNDIDDNDNDNDSFQYSPNNPFLAPSSSSASSTENMIPGVSYSQSPYGSLGEPVAPTPSVSWQAQYNSDVQRVTQNAMIYELTQQQTRTIEKVVPWFLQNMPASYFQQVPEQFRMDHIKAISAVKDANMDLYLNLKSHTADGTRTIYTFIRPSTQPGTLLSMVEELPYHEEHELTRLHVFSTHDKSMSLNMFIYGESPTKPRLFLEDENIAKILQFAAEVQDGQHRHILMMEPNPLFEKDALLKYLALCKDNYLKIVSQHPERFLRQRLLYHDVSGTEGVQVNVEEAVHEQRKNGGGDYYWIDVAMANSLSQVALEHTCRLLYVHGFDVGRARLDIIPDGDNGSVTLLRLLVHPQVTPTIPYDFELLQSDLKRAKWLDDTTQQLVFERYLWLGVTRGEIITALCSLMHPILAKRNAIAYSKHNIMVRNKKDKT